MPVSNFRDAGISVKSLIHNSAEEAIVSPLVTE
jgi:hypothetical protein